LPFSICTSRLRSPRFCGVNMAHRHRNHARA
jgi:hypothetical protein